MCTQSESDGEVLSPPNIVSVPGLWTDIRQLEACLFPVLCLASPLPSHLVGGAVMNDSLLLVAGP